MVSKDDVLRQATLSLEKAGIEDPSREARLLLCWVLQKDLSSIFGLKELSLEELSDFSKVVERRVAREPFAFITGETGFWTLDLYTTPATLIPRSDSEALIEAILKVLPNKKSSISFLDLGTGTGCLLLSALFEYQYSWGMGVDLSSDAAILAKKNAIRNGLQDRAVFLCGNWTDSLNGRFDVIFSNPPYIVRDCIQSLMPEVSSYEPSRALDGGTDGLDAYRILTKILPSIIVSGGYVILEVGEGQIDDVSALGNQQGFKEVLRHKDLGGIYRALVLQYGES